MRISKAEEAYKIEDNKGEITVPNLAEFTLPEGEFLTSNSTSWIAEEEIPIARGADGRTWEIRMLPPFGIENAYAKVGAVNKHVNNISQEGGRIEALEVIKNIIRKRHSSMSDEEIMGHAQAFLEKGYAIAEAVKDMTDAVQVDIAKQIIKPEDLQEPAVYDQVMQDAFNGNFYDVDITGVWDNEGKLSPVIIEAQHHAGLPDIKTRAFYRKCYGETIRKRQVIQAALK
ncbi:MAG: hypothetical protein ACREHC_06515 [Candidatus Levyibacteriota bacterium]